MLDLLFLGYVYFFAVLLPVLAMIIITIGAARADLSWIDPRRALIVPAVVLSLWVAIAMMLSANGTFRVPATLGEPPIVLMFFFGGAFMLWAMARQTAMGQAITDQIDPGLIAAFQIPRAMGGLFLLGWAAGVIPWQFALPAGLGDIWAGIAGYQAWSACRRKAPDARAKIIRANVIGIADFAVAMATGILSSQGFAQIWAFDSPNIINLHPLAMFPGFFVPLFLAFHLISISKLRQESRGLPVPE